MSCNVDIETSRRENVLSIPLTSVTVRENKPETVAKDERIQKKEDDKDKIKVKRPPSVVFMKNGLKAKMIEVKTGISDKGFIEILEGLKEGDEIISGNFMAVSKLLRDGSKIKFDVVSKKKSEKK
jgi:HlyD family secretion protein